MIICNLVNESGNEPLGSMLLATTPRKGEVVIKRREKGDPYALKVVGVVYHEGQAPDLHVVYHGSSFVRFVR